jgi:hypothetical protein
MNLHNLDKNPVLSENTEGKCFKFTKENYELLII